MRPVRLELNGFASFRDHTVVDFTDADYFVLIGPTGSGKSTILDAITFALYGTAYRWGATNAVADALAPSTNRCTVSLTFDAGPHRYQVAREVRRVGQSIQQKNPSLVRFADPHAVEIDPDGPAPEVLAGEIRELKTAIPELLGLDFQDFCQCVVLPQGQFARFLSSNPKERQKILLKLLGAEHYEDIGRQANARATVAGNALEIYGEQLAKHTAATPEAKAAADARVVALESLLDEVDELVPQVVSTAAAAATARADEARVREHAGLLSGVVAPDGVEELQTHAALARRTAEDARRAAEEAATAADEARRAVAAGPRRAEVERARERHEEVARLTERRPTVVETAATAEAALAESRRAHKDVAASTAEARTAVATKSERLRQAEALQTGLQDQRGTLSGVSAPDGLAELVSGAKELAERAEAARCEVPAAELRAEELEATLRAVGTRERLARTREELNAWRTTASQLALRQTELAAARESVEQTRRNAVAAGDVLDAAEEDRARSGLVVGAAQLRRTLHIGEPCPVCEQPLSELPPPLDDATTGAADTAVTAARTAKHAAEQVARDAEADLHRVDAKVATLEDRQSSTDHRLVGLLPDRPSGEHRDIDGDAASLAELKEQLATATTANDEARRALTQARDRAELAQSSSEAAERRLDGARAVLHTTLGTLSAYNPPAVDPDDLEAAWELLQGWATGRLGDLDRQLAEARAAHAVAAREHNEQKTALTELEGQLEIAHETVTSAATSATAETRAREAVDERLGELSGLLADAPAPDEIEPLLAECARLEAALETGDQTATAARKTATEREEEWRAWQAKAAGAATELTTARETVLMLSPPAVATDDLVAGWRTLAEWAGERKTQLEAEAGRLRNDAVAQQAEHDRLTDQLTRRTQELDIEVPVTDGTGGPKQAPRVVAVELQKARGDAEAIAASMAAAAELREQIETQRETQSVASTLAGLLRSNKFPRWLANSALDSLVAGASQSLHELSGGQYDLAHERGEFFVIDHADADLTRSVKTLSGGETYQASLALALALSDHLVGMGGSTKLESIFLDEGFGTLDPDALETVAATLENLSQGDRVVGVITHLAALAERAPVTFRVHRDSRTSHVERED